MMKENMSQDELKKMRRMSYIKMVAMFGFVVAVLAFGSIAWFTMSREVEQSGLAMTAEDLPFEIATKGSKGIRNLSELKSVDAAAETGIGTTINQDDYYQSAGNHTKIMIQYDSGESDIGPGGYGSPELYIIPKEKEALNIRVSMQVQCYAYFDVYKLDAEGQKIPEVDENDAPVYEDGVQVYQTEETLLNVNDASTAVCSDDGTTITNTRNAARYLQGHILFFGGSGGQVDKNEDGEISDDEKWYYSVPYPERTFTIQKTADQVTKGSPIPIPLHWMWANTLGQIVLKQPDDQRSGSPLVKDLEDNELNLTNTDKALLVAYVKANKDTVLMDWEQMLTNDELASIPGNADADEIQAAKELIADGLIDQAKIPDNFRRLSNCYNNADFQIGSYIKYFTIEVTVENVE